MSMHRPGETIADFVARCPEQERLIAEVRAERIAQGLPPTIEDPGFYRRFADLIDTDPSADPAAGALATMLVRLPSSER